MKSKSYTGINIQFPISRLILNGAKTIETRTYPIPQAYIDQEMAIIETPGKTGNFKSRIIGLIIFGNSFKYESEKSFYKDTKLHHVTQDSDWAWNPKKGKWGWPIKSVTPFNKSKNISKRLGIKYTKDIII